MVGLLALLLGGLALGLILDSGSGSDGDSGERGGGEEGDQISGTDGDDVIQGTGQGEVILPGPGDDFVRALGGDDIVVDGVANAQEQGDDTLYGDGGDDQVVSFGGSDSLFGGTRNDLLVATDLEPGEADTLSGGYGDDTLAGDDGDVLAGGEGTDLFAVGLGEFDPVEPVTITDFERDEVLQIEIYREDFFAGDGSDSVLVEDGSDGAEVTVNGVLLARLPGVPASFLTDQNFAVLDFR